MKKINYFIIAVVVIFITSCTNNQVKLNAAGATFPLPYYNLAFSTYKNLNAINISYGGIGSGGGIRSLKDKVVNFAGTDAYLSDKELAEMPSEVLHIPTCMGAVVMAFNLDNIENLNITPSIISDIYHGKISNWNDTAIAAINPNIKLPDLKITPVYRSDGSGTTFVFSDYMTKTSQEWKVDFGHGKSLKWKLGIAAKGNPGVAGVIKQTRGSIGYIGTEYAFAQDIKTAAIQNPRGEFIKATTKSIALAAEGDIRPDTRQMITASTTKGSYPISCFTWIIFYKDLSIACKDQQTQIETLKLLNWMLSDKAQELTLKVNYVPLPPLAIQAGLKILSTAK